MFKCGGDVTVISGENRMDKNELHSGRKRRDHPIRKSIPPSVPLSTVCQL